MSEDEEIEDTARFLEKVGRGDKVSPQRRLVFRSIEDLRSFLTPERLRLLRIIRREKPASVYELAKLAGRDRKSITTDLDVLAGLGLVQMGRLAGEGRRRSVPHVEYSRIEIAVEV